jgi:hypothetical protein
MTLILVAYTTGYVSLNFENLLTKNRQLYLIVPVQLSLQFTETAFNFPNMSVIRIIYITIRVYVSLKKEQHFRFIHLLVGVKQVHSSNARIACMISQHALDKLL